MANHNPTSPIGSMFKFSSIIILAAIWSLLSCGGEKQADWTLLFYFDGDNSLAEDAFKDLQELERVGSNPQIRLVAQADFPQNYKPDLAATRRFEIIQDDDPETLTSPLLESLGEADMADPRTLTDFIIWGKKNFPALSYALILWDHGEAWYQESITSQTTEVQGSRFLPAPRLRQAGKAQGHFLVQSVKLKAQRFFTFSFQL